MTNPAAVTKPIGLPADAQAVKFFAATLFKFTLTRQLCSIYHDLQKTRQPRHGRQLILTTGPLGGIASASLEPVHTREFIMTKYLLPFTGTASSPNFILTCPACPDAHLHMIIHGFVFEIYKTGS